MQHSKRIVAAYLAYRRKNDTLEFYLQKRDSNARTSKNMFGLFGGGLEEGESVEHALYREIDEEMGYKPVAPRYFSRYEHADIIFHLFIEEVGADVESKVTIQEGEYGKFFTSQEAATEPKATHMVRLMTKQICEYLGASEQIAD